MSNSRSERHKKNKARKEALSKRRAQAYRRRQGLAHDQEEAELASIFRRFFALALDQILYAFLAGFYLVLTPAFFGENLSTIVSTFLPAYVFGLGYIVPMISRSGQTFGCKRMKITIIDEEGTGFLSYKKSFYRWFYSFGLPTLITTLTSLVTSNINIVLVGAVVSLIITVIVIAPALWTENRQGIHDRLVGSVVVREIKF